MVEMITGWLGLLAPFWPWVKAIVLALLFSWGVTQLGKWCWKVYKGHRHLNPKESAERLGLRIVAGVTCFVPMYRLWPDAADAFWWAAVLSLLSPTIYTIVMTAGYAKWPALEKAMSANPPITIRYDEHGEPIGYKEGEDKTQFFNPRTEPFQEGDQEESGQEEGTGEEKTVPHGSGDSTGTTPTETRND